MSPYLYLYLFFGVDDSIEDVFTQRGDHSSGPMRNILCSIYVLVTVGKLHIDTRDDSVMYITCVLCGACTVKIIT